VAAKRELATASGGWRRPTRHDFGACIEINVTKLLIGLALSLIVVLIGRWSTSHWYDQAPPLRVAKIERRSMARVVSATGTLEPCEIVDVGAQVAGRVIEFGTDPETGKPIDYGSRVHQGMLLAKIDPSVYELDMLIAQAQDKRMRVQVEQSRHQVRQAEAAVARANAELQLQETKRIRLQRDWDRAMKLDTANSISTAEVDAARAELDSVEASMVVCRASIEEAESRLQSQRGAVEVAIAESDNAAASLERARTTLGYCSIYSPIDGTIIDRRVNQGQTVVASLQTPSLFLLASNLDALEIWVSVNEADIGLIREHLPVRFRVDANPDRAYEGSVKQVRLNASMSQNVVTYTVVVSVKNHDRTLIPYLTANVEFLVEDRSDVLAVPSSALRFLPPEEYERVVVEGATKAESSQAASSSVWVQQGSKLREIPVKLGISDGGFTEVIADELLNFDQVVVGMVDGDQSPAAASNPFVPKLPKRERKTPGEASQ
jgi:HlyD family secretion protein